MNRRCLEAAEEVKRRKSLEVWVALLNSIESSISYHFEVCSHTSYNAVEIKCKQMKIDNSEPKKTFDCRMEISSS